MIDGSEPRSADKATPDAVTEQQQEETSADVKPAPDSSMPLKPDPVAGSGGEDAPRDIRNLYATVYAFNLYTITDGAIRLIVLLHANSLGFTPIQIALMFSLYELAGVVTNLFGGVVGVRYGLKVSLFISLALQLAGLLLLLLIRPIFGDLTDGDVSARTRDNVTVYITLCQMLSGISKDFMKLSCKSVPKLVTKANADDSLFRLVAIVTGLKNSFKGFGSLFGAVLVQFAGFEAAVGVLLAIVVAIVPVPLVWMERDLGRGSKKTARFTWKAFRASHNVNVLSLARVFLFGARDVWFEIAAPIFIASILGWPKFSIGLLMGGYIVMYGVLQASTTKLYKKNAKQASADAGAEAGAADEGVTRTCRDRLGMSGPPTEKHVPAWAYATAVLVLVWGSAQYPMYREYVKSDLTSERWQFALGVTLIAGLVLFAVLFSVNSAVHSYLIVLYADKNKLTMQIGSYYSANALGRLVGTLLSGVIYQFTEEEFGISVCLWVSSVFMFMAGVTALWLRPHVPSIAQGGLEGKPPPNIAQV